MATLFYRLLDQYLTQQIEKVIQSSEGLNSIIWFWAGFSLLNSILFPTLLAIICLYALKNNSLRQFSSFLADHFEFSILETMRAWGTSILWGFLFIIPGLIKMSYYYLTTFVVLFLPEYAEGRIDALKKSQEISKPHWGALNGLVTLFYFVIPLIISTLLNEYTLFEKHPLWAAMNCAFEGLCILLFHYTVLKLFLKDFMPDPIPNTQGAPDVTYV